MSQLKIIAIIILIFVSIQLDEQINHINIEQFGVSGKDLTDDTQQFDNAIEYIAKYGGTLYVPNGYYILDNNKRIFKGVNGSNYIFLVSKDFKIVLDSNAVLNYKNEFKGFRFRSTQHPNEETRNRCSVEISGGIINGKENFKRKVLNNPDIWGFLGETLHSFVVTNLQIQNFYGSAGIAAYSNNFVNFKNNRFYNTTGNPYDLIDNHGDGIYIANTRQYVVQNNSIINIISVH